MTFPLMSITLIGKNHQFHGTLIVLLSASTFRSISTITSRSEMRSLQALCSNGHNIRLVWELLVIRGRESRSTGAEEEDSTISVEPWTGLEYWINANGEAKSEHDHGRTQRVGTHSLPQPLPLSPFSQFTTTAHSSSSLPTAIYREAGGGNGNKAPAAPVFRGRLS